MLKLDFVSSCSNDFACRTVFIYIYNQVCKSHLPLIASIGTLVNTRTIYISIYINVNKMNCDIFELFYEYCVNVQGPQNIGK